MNYIESCDRNEWSEILNDWLLLACLVFSSLKLVSDVIRILLYYMMSCWPATLPVANLASGYYIII